MNRKSAMNARPGLWLLIILMGGWLSLSAEAVEKRSRWQVEFASAAVHPRPDDLNLQSATDALLQKILLQNHNEDWGMNKEFGGGFPSVKSTMPLSLRIKYRLNGWLALSLGVERQTGSGGDTPFFQYSDDYTRDRLEYPLYSLKYTTLAPTIGLHLVQRRLFGGFSGGAYITAGPVFADCRHEKSWRWRYWEAISETSGLIQSFDDTGETAMKGTGTGYAVEIGARLGLRVFSRVELFVDGGYAFSRVGELSGSGSELRAGRREEWNGAWRIQRETLTLLPDRPSYEYITNRPASGGEGGQARDFSLDLSSFRLRLGLTVSL